MKKIVTGQGISIKDENGAYVRSQSASSSAPPPPPQDPIPSEINLSELLDKHLLVLYRETRSLLQETAHGDPLTKDRAHSMRENIKLLMDLIKKEKELLSSLPKEELDKLLNDG